MLRQQKKPKGKLEEKQKPTKRENTTCSWGL